MTPVFTRTTRQQSKPFTGKNRRANDRYAVTAPLEYRVMEDALNAAWKSGRSLDMSAWGIRIDIGETAPAGSRLELAMDWPGLYHGKTVVCLYMTACVLRVDGCGTAMRILSRQFRDVRPATVRRRRVA